MAQRTGTSSDMVHLPVQSEEGVSVPACSGGMPGNRTERTIDASVPFETGGHDPDLNGASPPFTFQSMSDRRDPRIACRSDHLLSLADLSGNVWRRTQPQIFIPGQFGRPHSGTLTEVTDRDRLQSPADTADQML